MDKIEKIRQEIERQIGSVNEKQDANPAMPKYRWHMYEGMKEAFIDMKYFLDTLSEKPDKSLEEAAQQYADGPECTWAGTTALEYAFKAGAKWQKEQMMKDAVEGEVRRTNNHKHTSVRYKTFYGTDRYFYGIADKQFRPGDKVRIIIVKEDDK